MSDVREYKCPSCDGHLNFDPNAQKMKCPYCDSEFEMSAVEEFNNAKNSEEITEDSFSWEKLNAESWSDEESSGLRSYMCNTCSGEIVTDATTAAASCPYCGNPVVMTDRLSGLLKPEKVIPFKYNKAQAMQAYKKHISNKKLLPDVFRKQNHIDEIKGIYVPFWLFDAAVQGSAQYKATTTSTWSDSDYTYTKTSHYSVFRGGSMAFGKIPVDGSSKMADELMESIEPFNFSEAVDFNTAYLSGYFADKYDVDVDASIVRANERIKSSTEEALRSTVHGYSSVIPTNSFVNMLNGASTYALYPVWILNTTWNGQKFTFAMNGQTGKMVGDLPMDKGKFSKYFAISSVIGTVLGFGATVLFNLFFG